MTEWKNDAFKNTVNHERLSDRQIDELIGLARGIAADGEINQSEAEFLHKWLAANMHISRQPIVSTLYHRVSEMLHDGHLDSDEKAELLDTLNSFSSRDFEIGEVLKSTSLPLCRPAPSLSYRDINYCFTGTFNFGSRKVCENAVEVKGGKTGSLSLKTNVLVIGLYATESWRHSSFGNKILKAVEYRDKGAAISIVSEEHWVASLSA